jgi:RNA polymerase sigma-70 factor (ECF subfamily)
MKQCEWNSNGEAFSDCSGRSGRKCPPQIFYAMEATMNDETRIYYVPWSLVRGASLARLRPHTAKVFLALLAHDGPNGIYPTIPTLATECVINKKTVWAAIKELEAAQLAQRIVRAKAKIKSAGIPFHVPSRIDMPERLDGVLHVIYLVFNEGYAASSGDLLTRGDLSGEAIRLGRLLMELLPEQEVVGLLALMLLQESRRIARTSAGGDLILLEDQNRAQWNRDQIAEGLALVRRASLSRRFGPYTLQAAIAAVHAQAPSAAATDLAQITALYDLLLRIAPSPVVELNRAVALAMRDGPAEGLRLIDSIIARGDLLDYHLAHAARAELCRRLGKMNEAKAAYERAISLVRQEPEKRFLEQRLRGLPF